MSDSATIAFSIMGAVIVLTLTLLVGMAIGEGGIRQDCERYGQFYIADNHYSCAAIEENE